jgi:hypothetical protein
MSRTLLSVGAITLSTLAGSAHAVIYFDGTFNDPDWTLTAFNNPNGAGSFTSGFQLPVGGNGGQYRIIRNNLVASGSNAAINGFHMNVTAFYNPVTQGAISYIDYSEDSKNFVSDLIVPGNGQGSGLVILQNGIFYAQRNPILVMPYVPFQNWLPNVASGLVASDFHEVDPLLNINPFSNPDFSATGSVMQLGFWRGNSGNGSYNTECGIDNWRVEIVPAPGAASALAACGLLMMRRRR